MKLLRDEQGQMIIMTAIELALLVGFLALAADVGVLFHSKRQMQIAADAAATAAALNDYNVGLGYTTQSDASAAYAAATKNGYTNGQDGVTITVNTPPTSGYHQKQGYVEVVISKPDPLYFFKFFTRDNSATVAARAVAGDPVASPECGNSQSTVLIGGSGIQGPNCGISTNSTSPDAFDNNDNGTTVNTLYNQIAGSSAKFDTSPTPVTYGPPVNPPYQNIYMPNPTDSGSSSDGGTTICNSGNTYAHSVYDPANYPTYTLPSGADFTYTDSSGNAVTVNNVVCFPSNVTFGKNSQSAINLPSGFYFFENGATMNGSITFGLDGSGCNSSGVSSATIGAVIYNYAGSFQQGNGQLGVCAPTGGEYNGVAVMQPSWGTNPPPNTNSLNLQFGMSGNAGTSCSIQSAALNGYIVAPSATLSLHDNGGGLLVTGYVVNELYIKSSTLTMCNYNIANKYTTPLRAIALVE